MGEEPPEAFTGAFYQPIAGRGLQARENGVRRLLGRRRNGTRGRRLWRRAREDRRSGLDLVDVAHLDVTPFVRDESA